MPIDAICESCHKQYKLADRLAGKKVKCRDCGLVIQVPVLHIHATAHATADGQQTQIKIPGIKFPEIIGVLAN